VTGDQWRPTFDKRRDSEPEQAVVYLYLFGSGPISEMGAYCVCRKGSQSNFGGRTGTTRNVSMRKKKKTQVQGS